ncbi:excitatory amino acid transporter 4-like [Bacillus rossius redtenbacheri]|uniref:excitatory amino acid transporter 4-like n=1 Tax=Bacillus rossius redtenbacheri TaxID=93214 RepID=UPI002FDDE944
MISPPTHSLHHTPTHHSQSSLIVLVMVLDTVGLPPSDASFIIAVDWMIERFRTIVNVISDSVGVGIVDHLSRGELEEADRQAEALGIGRRRSSMRYGSSQVVAELAAAVRSQEAASLLGHRPSRENNVTLHVPEER